MFLGVPVLSRYDLLERLIASAEAGSLKPTTYFIVDNGGQFDAMAASSPAIEVALARGAAVRVLSVGKNLGVAASWNAMLNAVGDDAVVISNDDVVLGRDTLRDLSRAVGDNTFVVAEGGYHANGWCLFAQNSWCTRNVGYYDENFYPAYYEDSDYLRRLKLAGITPFRIPSDHSHEGWATIQKDDTNAIRDGQERNYKYFVRKWGGPPNEEKFEVPFDGADVDWKKDPLDGPWNTYRRPIKRWDVVNSIAEKIGARTYLEIGVASGESMRHVKISWKEGVDPAPAIEGSTANVLHRATSEEFFNGLVVKPYDVVFVDGLHLAEQAYRDIENACRNARVVVVHDSNPTTETMQRVPYAGGEWTGDVWKAIARIRREGRHAVRTIDADYGVAVVIPDAGESIVELPAETYDDLCRNRKELLGLISPEEWMAWFDGIVPVGKVRSETRVIRHDPPGISIHLGCSDVKIAGFLNVDERSTSATDLVADCSRVSFCADGSVKLFYSHAFFEHVYRRDQVPLLTDMRRALLDDGAVLFAGIPNFEVYARAYLGKYPGHENRIFDLHEVYRYTHGDPESFPAVPWIGQLHKSLFDVQTLVALLEGAKYSAFQVFSYAWGGELHAVNLGFVAGKNSIPSDWSNTLENLLPSMRLSTLRVVF